MNIGRALTFLFSDPRWARKLAIAVVANVLPTIIMAIGSFNRAAALAPWATGMTGSPWWPILSSLSSVPLFGYVLRIARNVIAGHDLPLPDWSDVTGILKDGLMLWGVITLWQLPITILGQASRVNTTIGESGVVNVLSSLLGIAILIIQPAAEGRLAASGALAAGIDVTAALNTVRGSVGAYLKLALVMLAGGMLGVAIGIALVMFVATPLGILPGWRDRVEAGIVLAFLLLLPFGLMVWYHLIGQVYVRATRRHGTGVRSGPSAVAGAQG